MARSGRFKPSNITKYRGDYRNIIYRSSWEKVFMHYCDKNSNIIEWGSEEVIIPYRSPLDNRLHRYYPDFWVKTDQGESLIEIKPKKQTKPPKPNPKHRRRYLKEVKTWGVNEAKWKAAELFCEAKGWKWQIITEDTLTTK